MEKMAGMGKMADMKMSKSEKKNDMMPAMNAPDFPWGLRINLDEAAIKKLGIKELPEAGCECHVMAMGKVISVSSTATEGKADRHIELQITNMSLVCPDSEEDAKKSFAKGYRKVRKS